MSTMPTRVDGDLFAAAKFSGALHSRSGAQQIAHWARIGRELEAPGGVSHWDVAAMFSGGFYDAVMEREQAVVRGVRDEKVAQRLTSLDLSERFGAGGVGWVEADEDGRLVTKTTAGA